jgi:hypothetical protein
MNYNLAPAIIMKTLRKDPTLAGINKQLTRCNTIIVVSVVLFVLMDILVVFDTKTIPSSFVSRPRRQWLPQWLPKSRR